MMQKHSGIAAMKARDKWHLVVAVGSVSKSAPHNKYAGQLPGSLYVAGQAGGRGAIRFFSNNRR